MPVCRQFKCTGWKEQIPERAKSANSNQVLESGEHAILAVAFAENERPRSLDKISIEVIVSNGATLTIERHIPNITHEVMDLG